MTTSQQNIYNCNLLGEWGIIFQASLGILAFGVLICKILLDFTHKSLKDKRYKEHPRRVWKIWLLVRNIQHTNPN